MLDSKLPWTDPGLPLSVERLGLAIPGYTRVNMLVGEVEGEKANDNDPGRSIRLAFSKVLAVPRIIHKYAAGYNK